jgi:hypothetical protein
MSISMRIYATITPLSAISYVKDMGGEPPHPGSVARVAAPEPRHSMATLW